jgi:hypothetical protein
VGRKNGMKKTGGYDCGSGDAAFCKCHPGVCDGCRRASESGEAALWARRRADLAAKTAGETER